jgi:hypothetical protein
MDEAMRVRLSLPPKTGPLIWLREGEVRWLGNDTLTRTS